jgi:hypothetical protein
MAGLPGGYLRIFATTISTWQKNRYCCEAPRKLTYSCCE